MRSPRQFALLLLALSLFLTGVAQAQLGVDLQIKRRTFMVNEPILATVVVTNNVGREVMLADTVDGGPWFSFQITAVDGRIVPPRNAKYEVEPLRLNPGETMKRTVNLNELYTLGDFGTYRIKASVYYPEFGKYFGSKLDHFAIMEGKMIWKQIVGVPESKGESDGYRQVSLLTMEHDKGKMLYVRVEGTQDGIIYGCYNLGRIMDGTPPDAKFDAGNNLAVLQLVGPKTYALSRIGVNGDFLGQHTYITPKTQPFLRKTADGTLQIVGAVRQQVAQQTLPIDAVNVPKVSDRPPGF